MRALPLLLCVAMACSSASGVDGGVGGGTQGGTGGGSAGGGAAGGGAGGSAGGSAGGAAGGSAGGAAGGSATGGGSGGGAATGDGGMPCTWNDGGYTCPAGQYCNAPGCGAGVCETKPSTSTGGKQALCGCDGVTWWNADAARARGMSIASSGECSPGRFCGGFGGLPCPSYAACNYQVAGKDDCLVSDASGTCWGMPAQCPQILIGVHSKDCLADTCTDECSLVSRQVTWYSASDCPQ